MPLRRSGGALGAKAVLPPVPPHFQRKLLLNAERLLVAVPLPMHVRPLAIEALKGGAGGRVAVALTGEAASPVASGRGPHAFRA